MSITFELQHYRQEQQIKRKKTRKGIQTYSFVIETNNNTNIIGMNQLILIYHYQIPEKNLIHLRHNYHE